MKYVNTRPIRNCEYSLYLNQNILIPLFSFSSENTCAIVSVPSIFPVYKCMCVQGAE